MASTDPLIRTKLRLPFTPPNLVARPRLQERLAQGLHGPLTLVIAPAGFGKTTLVAAYLAGRCLPVAWLSLDKDDNRPGRFLRYLVAALQQADSAVGNEAGQLLLASGEVSPEAVLTSLVNDLDTVGRDITLVLDDYQFITDRAVHGEVAFLLEHCPKALHLVIASRSDPPLPVARLRARGQAAELRAADLSFTEREASQFLGDAMNLCLSPGAVATLETRTEGWIAGLQMAALAMRGREDLDAFVCAFAGTNRYIMSFMLEEVLAREPEGVQAFLLQTSVLARLSGPLCDAVIGASGGQEMLVELEKRNLFIVPLDDERRWYRYHHLFADLLQAKLRQSGRNQVAQLLSRAAAWCEQEGQTDEAVSYALAAEDYRRAARLVARHWQQKTSLGEIDTVWCWLRALPPEEVRANPALAVAYCWLLWLTGQIGAIEAHLTDAERALGHPDVLPELDGSGPEHALLPMQIAALRSFVCRYRDEFAAATALAERALGLMPANLPPEADAQLRSLALLALASACDGSGDLEKAANAYAEAIRCSRLAGNAAGLGIIIRLSGILCLLGRLPAADAACREALAHVQARGMARVPAAGILHVALSEVLTERNDLEAAEAHLAQGIEIGRLSGRLDAAKNAANVLVRLKLARQDANGALAAVAEAEAAQTEPPSHLARAELLALKARVFLRQGSPDRAAPCIEEATRLAGRDRGLTGETVALAASRVLLARGKPGDTEGQLSRSLAAAEASGRLGVALELRILRSLLFARQGRTREAEANLERALAIAEPGGYVRIFLDEGRPMQMLIAQWLAHASSSPLRDYAIRLLYQFDAEQHTMTAAQAKAASAGRLVEPLSERELEVLHLLATGSTNREIARHLILAPGTIKAHTASIYRKLDVANRTEAVARARQLGLLP